MSTRAYARRHAHQRSGADADVVSEHPLVQPADPSLAQAPSPAVGSAIDGAERLTHDFGQVAVQPSERETQTPLTQQIQMKRRVSQPGDPHEQEADRVADAVTRTPDTPASEAPTHLAAQAAHESGSSGSGGHSGSSGGQPLDTATRAYMEPRFGHDFGHVRVHTDVQAAEAAESVGARAYTVGGDIVFGAQEYAPDTTSGRHLLAHELTHVVQQQGDAMAANTVQREPEPSASATPEAVPAGPPSSLEQAAADKPSDARPLDDATFVESIVAAQMDVLDNWHAALGDFKAILDAHSDVAESSGFLGTVINVFTEAGVGKFGEYLGLVVKIGEAAINPAELAVKVAMGAYEDWNKQKEAAEAHAARLTVSQFYIQHNDAITRVKNSVRDSGPKYKDLISRISDAMMVSVDSKKGKGEAAMTNAAYEYSMLEMAMNDAYDEVEGRKAYWTPERVFQTLTEEWLGHATSKYATKEEHAAHVIVRLKADYSAIDAYFEGYSGKDIGDQLLAAASKHGQNGIDIWHLKAPRKVIIFAENGWALASVDLDENNNRVNPNEGIQEDDARKLYRHLQENGLPLIDKVDGDK